VVQKLSKGVTFLVIFVTLLAVLDVGFTLCHIQWANGAECNPLMGWVLDSFGSTIFIGVKVIVTGIGVSFFAYFYNKTQWAKIALWSVVTIHSILAIYHIYLAVTLWK
jgi:hypothetical protein